ncbi:23S rRNA (uracil(1939)-C(5))-methyltransferase RlmD [Vampirovibrio sp.]|uniref:23S rRNA (uracil(1939)-C(5))-methyltransferase RlmD n=1 Tax=Vampirovibrio sp. TaxID=2717857 RepID=UPI003593C166
MELTIEKLVYGGEGLGRTPEGEVIFVPYSAPQDILSVERVRGSAKPAKATISSIVTPSGERVEPACSVFEECGGCQWQHLSITAQRSWKHDIVLESLNRIGKMPDVAVLPTLSVDDDGWKSRNRVQWEIEPAGDELAGNPIHKLGYYQAQSHDIVEFDHCHVIPDALNQVALRMRQLIRENASLASGLLRIEAFISPAPEEEILLTLSGEKNQALKPLAEQLMQEFPTIQGVCYLDSGNKDATPRPLAGDSALEFSLAGNQYRVSAGHFFQTSYAGAETLLNILEKALPESIDSLLDVYAGVGLFSIHFAKRTQRVLAIESSPSTEADAHENFSMNEIINVAWKTGDARQSLRALNEKFEVAIVDPPRGGCQPEVLNWLSQHIEKQLVYVSCNPTTLARDLKLLVAQGWKIDMVQPVDMFPHTYHVETVVSLSR